MNFNFEKKQQYFYYANNLSENSQPTPLDISYYSQNSQHSQNSNQSQNQNKSDGIQNGISFANQAKQPFESGFSSQSGFKISTLLSQIPVLDGFLKNKGFANGVVTVFRQNSKIFTQNMCLQLISSALAKDEKDVWFIDQSGDYNPSKLNKILKQKQMEKKLSNVVYGRSLNYKNMNIQMQKMLKQLSKPGQNSASLILLNISDIMNFSCDTQMYNTYSQFSNSELSNLEQFVKNLKNVEIYASKNGLPIIMFCQDKLMIQESKMGKNPTPEKKMVNSDNIEQKSINDDQETGKKIQEQDAVQAQEFLTGFSKSIQVDTVISVQETAQIGFKLSVLKTSYIEGVRQITVYIFYQISIKLYKFSITKDTCEFFFDDQLINDQQQKEKSMNGSQLIRVKELGKNQLQIQNQNSQRSLLQQNQSQIAVENC
ncbi:hypothetical protein PPERSA_03469 [Pseudocohnilembus persalinus]|uniref:P-loop containing nucleoside triphosphate hydrolase n=1 Tax=Pseudocohnilembus persalinus TaxID=266149 RepID=A0A0V0QC94_PSEPJ|nr:hypothetical protein PPERSA_03469 [Pseudocohnilembus persalinus]|eukprot:KRW99668.1 hypothetical protein PPERSA_03469 [Pseudocohnilembus persalinus]